MFLRTVLVLSLASLAWAQADKPKLPGEDWMRLFNGKDLNGWTKIGNEEWSVQDGIIHGKAVTRETAICRPKRPTRISIFR